MTTYMYKFRELDEVLVTGHPYLGGVGLVAQMDTVEPLFTRVLVEGTTPAGEKFSRWYTPADLTPVEWGTWRFQITTVADPTMAPIFSADITDRPIEPVEMILESLVDVPWMVVESRDARRVAVATRHIETVEVYVIDRRDSR